MEASDGGTAARPATAPVSGWVLVAILAALTVGTIATYAVVRATTDEPDRTGWVAEAWLGPPRFVGDVVVVPSDSRVYGFGVDGEVRWESPPCWGAGWPGPVERLDVEEAVLVCEGQLVGIDPATGEISWEVTAPPRADRIRIGPGSIMVADEQADRMDVIDAASGEPRWSVPDGDVSMAATEDQVYVASDAGLTARDVEDGAVRWEVPYPSSGLFTDGRALYARGNDHRLRRFDLDTGHLVWESVRMPAELGWSEVVAAGDDVVLVESTREPSYLSAFATDDGEARWQLEVDGAGTRYRASADGPDVAAAVDGQVVLLDPESGDVTERLGDSSSERASVSDGWIAYVVPGAGGGQQLRVEPLD